MYYDIKRCFCGMVVEVEAVETSSGVMYRVCCNNCPSVGKSELTVKQAVDAWNEMIDDTTDNKNSN